MVIARVCVIVFAVEVSIMIGFNIFEFHPDNNALISLVDAALLVIICGPILYFLVLRPHIQARDLATTDLQESEEKFRAIAETANDGIITIDDRGMVVFWNKQAEAIFGFSEDEMVGSTLAKIIPPPLHQMHAAALERLRAGGEPRYIGRRLDRVGAHKDGHGVSLELTVSIQEVGDRGYFTGIVRDVSERKRAEEALRESEERYRGVAANLPGLVYQRVREPDGRVHYTYMSPAVREIYGTEPDEILADPQAFLDRVHPSDRDRYRASLRESAKTLEVWDEEFRAVTRDGEEKWVRGRSRPRKLENGAVVWDSILLDVTERMQADEILRKSRETLNEILQALPVSIALKNMRGRYELVNAGYAAFFGMSSEELVGKSPTEIYDLDVGKSIEDRDRQVLESGEPMPYYEQNIRNSSGVECTWMTTKSPLKNADGSIRGVISISLDITERRATEEQLRQAQKMEAIGQLIGGMAHDFNNLLTVILGNLQLLERAIGPDEKLKRRIATAANAALRGADLNKRLLAFSRRQMLESKVIDVNELVSGTQELLGRTLGETIELKTVLGEDLWPTRVDPSQLEAAMLNLAVNARDAMPDGGTLSIETTNIVLDDRYAVNHVYVTPGPHVMVAVSDTGTGMAREVIERCFEPFFTTKETGKGSGLGLSMVYGFAKQSGGHVNVYSEQGHGTTIKLYLPKADQPATDAAHETVESEEDLRGSETILVVEDQPDVRETISALLEELGYDVVEAEDGPAALALLEQGQDVDLLLTDMVLPGGMDGRVIASHARELKPNLKVIYISGYTADAILQKGLGDPDALFIAKPPQRRELASKLRRALDG